MRKKLGLTLLLGGCAVSRPLPIELTPPAVSAYLTDHPTTNIQVTEQSGHRYWLHAPELRGDSLHGRQGYDVPDRLLSVPLNQVIELRQSHFSWGRTGALIGATLLTTGFALAVLIDHAEPVY
jgi:hypothetical protein